MKTFYHSLRPLLCAALILLTTATSAADAKPDLSDFEKTARITTNAFNEGDYATYLAVFDFREIGTRIMEGFDMDESYVDTMQKQLESSLITQLQNSPPGEFAQGARLLRVTPHGDGAKAMIRIDRGLEGGVAIIELDLARTDDGVRAVDSYDYTVGSTMVQNARSLFALAMGDTSMLQRAIKTISGKRQNAFLLRDYMNAVREGTIEEVLATYAALPGDVQSDRAALVSAAVTAANTGDEQKILAVGRELAKRFGSDPTLGMVLVDYYILTGNIDGALESLERVSDAIGVRDSSLVGLMAMIAAEDDAPKAITLYEEAAELNPDFVFAYWAMLYLHAEVGDYSAAADTASVLTDRFDYYLTDEEIAGMPELAGWRESAEYKAWQGSR